MAKQMTHEKRARRYLEASMASGATGLPGEAREAHEAIMRSHERSYPDVREHALAGADQDFDKPLSAGAREHQRHLRDQEGLQHKDVLRIRRELRATPRAVPSRRARVSNAARAGARGGRAAYRSRPFRQTGVPGAARETGSLVMYAVGIAIMLSLAYLLLNENGKGPKAFSTALGLITNILGIFISPVDPLAPGTLSKIGETKKTAPKPSSSAMPAGIPRAATQTLQPLFGPAPGIPVTIGGTAIGGYAP
jgi:hypothetical protein